MSKLKKLLLPLGFIHFSSAVHYPEDEELGKCSICERAVFTKKYLGKSCKGKFTKINHSSM